MNSLNRRNLIVRFTTLGSLLALGVGLLFTKGAVAQHHGGAECGDPALPLLGVPDYDGDGTVTGQDVSSVAKVMQSGDYYAIYDRDADGDVDSSDLYLTVSSLGQVSSTFDQEIATAYFSFIDLQFVDDAYSELVPEFAPVTGPLAGHGVHWLNNIGLASVFGQTTSSFDRTEGLNIPIDGSGVWGMFWGQAAIPVFENGATDWPTPGGNWESSRVVAFAGEPPVFTSGHHENWHTHAGLCIVVEEDNTYSLHQHTSYQECQQYSSLRPTGPANDNAWVNMWMLHMWFFELNPNGFFGNTHPCLDPDAPSEDEINDDREVPPFFEHHG